MGLLFSDTFADDRFGILVDAGYADSKVRGNHVNIQGWEGGRGDAWGSAAARDWHPANCTGLRPAPLPRRPDGIHTIKDWFIQDYGIYQEHNDDKRIGGRLVLQARPVDGLEITLDDNYSRGEARPAAVWLQRLVQQRLA